MGGGARAPGGVPHLFCKGEDPPMVTRWKVSLAYGESRRAPAMSLEGG